MKNALHKLQHPTTTRRHHLPYQLIATSYGSTATKLAHPTDNSPSLNPDEARNVQKVVGNILYYVCTVDPTMIFTLNTIAVEQSKSTQETAKKLLQLLNYAATHPEAITCYQSR